MRRYRGSGQRQGFEGVHKIRYQAIIAEHTHPDPRPASGLAGKKAASRVRLPLFLVLLREWDTGLAKRAKR
ncbi:MAG TPA: hypothetical protein GX507_08655 [Clostridia bacterium]|nr:hypothetical protein [Clostridia bacterium]